MSKHSHECPNPKCGYVWEHDVASIPDDNVGFNKAHTCSKCGTRQTWKYYGDKPAGECNNGARIIAYDNHCAANPLYHQPEPYNPNADHLIDMIFGI